MTEPRFRTIQLELEPAEAALNELAERGYELVGFSTVEAQGVTWLTAVLERKERAHPLGTLVTEGGVQEAQEALEWTAIEAEELRAQQIADLEEELAARGEKIAELEAELEELTSPEEGSSDG